MASFFDDIGRKISQASQSAVQKTKDITDITRINGVIAEEEKKVNSNYCQLGKLYFSKHSQDCESDFSGLVAAIADSETRIQQLRQQIQDIKGFVKCEKCGASIANNVGFCSACGAAKPVKAPVVNENTVACPACRQMVEKGTKFCTYCGTPMTQTVPAQPETVQPEAVQPETVQQPVAQPVETAPVADRCPNCNSEVAADSVFCTCCGTRMK